MFKFAKAASTVALAGGLMAAMSATAFAADIEGTWRTQSGEKAKISKCGGSYCVTLTTGQYSGKRIGKMSGSGSSYKGQITDPTNNKTYSGSAKVNGGSMSLKGCVAKVFCRTQKWSRL
ncbi:MAG: DUF2147 domain-containing protein [Pseudomonadota bacterium]